ncbi:MAG: LysM peptidoglycan-binding domain-containing protein [Actinobacteria bacterium]|nr:LysM peptidoglycan-binding domain-containing protein [Actinomycetota bacterium]
MSRLHRVVVAALVGVSAVAVAVTEPALAAPPASSATVNSTYTVVKNDSLIGISVKLKVKVKDLLTVNNLRLDSLIWPGMQLVVPAGAAPVAAATTPATGSSAPLTYTVVKGDFLTGIAVKLNVKLKDLLTANSLSLNSLILPGKQLVVPAGGSLPASTPTQAPATAAAAAPVQYVVASGDSLSVVATRLGVTLNSLLTTNKLSVSSVIHPGMKLTVPSGGSLPVAPAAAAPAAGTAGATAQGTPVPTVGGQIGKVLAFAQAQLGKPYKFNTAGPNTYDCSGLTLAAFATIGIDLPHYSGAQMAFGTSIDWTTQAIQPGDLVFLESAPGTGIINHVGIATSATTWIQAPRTGDVVRTGSIPTYRVVGVQRLVNG